MELLPGLALAAGALLVWALGLYVFSARTARPAPILATAATGLLAAYLVGESLAALARTLKHGRRGCAARGGRPVWPPQPGWY